VKEILINDSIVSDTLCLYVVFALQLYG